MELKHIDIANLSVSAANMRAKGSADIANIMPSIRARGVLVPLIVRPAEGEDRFEIVAGKRRYHAARALAEESGESDPLPCAVMSAGDDAAALEASLIENIARLDPDEVTRWESFTRLVREGRSPEDIALTFGLTELQVKRTLALGNLLPRIRTLYRKGEIDVATVRHLTLASKARQLEWLALLDDPEVYCPTGYQLKAWLFGGASIPISAAIFDMADYSGEIVSDLFGDERYFADSASFWTAQTVAIEAKAESYREAGWSEIVILPTGEPFHSWEHERCPKRKGGKVFIGVGARGEVAIHEGYVSLKEARKRDKGETVEKPVRPEVSSPIQNYVDLHRHAAVRADLAGSPALALRLMVAHAIVGSSLWNVRVEVQRAHNDAIAESVEGSTSEAVFDEKRRAVLAVLGFDPEAPTVTGGYDGEHGVAGLFVRLLPLADAQVLEVAAVVIGETLEAGSALIELLGPMLGTDMAKVWQGDDALIDMIRDREHREIARTNGDKIIANPGLALDAITRTQATFTTRDLAMFAHRHSEGKDQFDQVMAAVRASPELVALGKDGRGEDRFTSRDMIETEQRLARETQALAEREHHRVAERDRERATVSAERRGLVLSAEQRSAFEHVTDTKDLGVVIGYAGTGKSAKLDAMAAQPGSSKTAILTDALTAWFDRRAGNELDQRFGTRLDRQNRIADRTEQKIDYLTEALGLFIRHQLTLTAHQPAFDTQTNRLGRLRYDEFMKVVGRVLARSDPNARLTHVNTKE